jgi:hypothetical protein
MSRYDTLRYEMFLRVSEFGISHRQQFPESSPAGQAFAAVAAAAAAKFDTHASARRLAGEDSRKVKANVSRAIHRRLTSGAGLSGVAPIFSDATLRWPTVGGCTTPHRPAAPS